MISYSFVHVQYYHRPCLNNRKVARLSRAASPIPPPPSSSLKKRKEDSDVDADEESIKKVKTEESLNESSSADEMSWEEPGKEGGASVS